MLAAVNRADQCHATTGAVSARRTAVRAGRGERREASSSSGARPALGPLAIVTSVAAPTSNRRIRRVIEDGCGRRPPAKSRLRATAPARRFGTCARPPGAPLPARPAILREPRVAPSRRRVDDRARRGHTERWHRRRPRPAFSRQLSIRSPLSAAATRARAVAAPRCPRRIDPEQRLRFGDPQDRRRARRPAPSTRSRTASPTRARRTHPISDALPPSPRARRRLRCGVDEDPHRSAHRTSVTADHCGSSALGGARARGGQPWRPSNSTASGSPCGVSRPDRISVRRLDVGDQAVAQLAQHVRLDVGEHEELELLVDLGHSLGAGGESGRRRVCARRSRVASTAIRIDVDGDTVWCSQRLTAAIARCPSRSRHRHAVSRDLAIGELLPAPREAGAGMRAGCRTPSRGRGRSRRRPDPDMLLSQLGTPDCRSAGDLEVALPGFAPLGLGSAVSVRTRAGSTARPWPAAVTASRIWAKIASARRRARPRNTISSPRCSVPAARRELLTRPARRRHRRSAAPTGTTTSPNPSSTGSISASGRASRGASSRAEPLARLARLALLLDARLLVEAATLDLLQMPSFASSSA